MRPDASARDVCPRPFGSCEIRWFREDTEILPSTCSVAERPTHGGPCPGPCPASPGLTISDASTCPLLQGTLFNSFENCIRTEPVSPGPVQCSPGCSHTCRPTPGTVRTTRSRFCVLHMALNKDGHRCPSGWLRFQSESFQTVELGRESLK